MHVKLQLPIENGGTLASQSEILSTIGNMIMENRVAYMSYKRLQEQGTKVIFNFDISARNLERGVFDGFKNKITINIRANKDPQQVISTLTHEAHHQRTFFRHSGNDVANIYEEYKAFRREFFCNNGAKPSLDQRIELWKEVYDAYSVMPHYQDIFGNVKLGFNEKTVPDFLKKTWLNFNGWCYV